MHFKKITKVVVISLVIGFVLTLISGLYVRKLTTTDCTNCNDSMTYKITDRGFPVVIHDQTATFGGIGGLKGNVVSSSKGSGFIIDLIIYSVIIFPLIFKINGK
jgi:hypothetical protein